MEFDTTAHDMETALAMIRDYLSLIRFTHTIFALPFAGLASVWAVVLPWGDAGLSRWQLLWRLLGILLCMVAARSAAMAFNRLVDQDFDAENERTSSRHLPSGILMRHQVWWFFALCCLMFSVSTLLFLPNRLPAFLAIPVLGWICLYSYAKRFTWMVHLWLGIALALAPVCSWIAIRGELFADAPLDVFPAVLLGIAVAFWVAGFDIIYSTQDADFDRSRNLSSMPARFGLQGALRIAALFHLLMWLTLAGLPWLIPELKLGWMYFTGLALVAGLLVRQHLLVNPTNLSRVNEAFFTMNAIISFGLTTLAGIDTCMG